MRLRLVGVLAGCAALAGCGALRTVETTERAPSVEAPLVQPAVVRPATNVENLLWYFTHLKKIPSAELGREHDIARQAYARARSDFNRVRFALVLSLPNTGFSDEARALDLLDPVAKNRAGELQGLALLLSSHLQEQKRLSASVEGLQRKLDALKTLERSLIERDSGGAARKR